VDATSSTCTEHQAFSCVYMLVLTYQHPAFATPAGLVRLVERWAAMDEGAVGSKKGQQGTVQLGLRTW
jgi:hypothetical protein